MDRKQRLLLVKKKLLLLQLIQERKRDQQQRFWARRKNEQQLWRLWRARKARGESLTAGIPVESNQSKESLPVHHGERKVDTGFKEAPQDLPADLVQAPAELSS